MNIKKIIDEYGYDRLRWVASRKNAHDQGRAPEMAEMEERLVDVKDLKKHFGPPVSWWYARAEAGDVPSFKLGKYRKFRLSEVAAWIEKQRTRPRPA